MNISKIRLFLSFIIVVFFGAAFSMEPHEQSEGSLRFREEVIKQEYLRIPLNSDYSSYEGIAWSSDGSRLALLGAAAQPDKSAIQVYAVKTTRNALTLSEDKCGALSIHIDRPFRSNGGSTFDFFGTAKEKFIFPSFRALEAIDITGARFNNSTGMNRRLVAQVKGVKPALIESTELKLPDVDMTKKSSILTQLSKNIIKREFEIINYFYSGEYRYCAFLCFKNVGEKGVSVNILLYDITQERNGHDKVKYKKRDNDGNPCCQMLTLCTFQSRLEAQKSVFMYPEVYGFMRDNHFFYPTCRSELLENSAAKMLSCEIQVCDVDSNCIISKIPLNVCSSSSNKWTSYLEEVTYLQHQDGVSWRMPIGIKWFSDHHHVVIAFINEIELWYVAGNTSSLIKKISLGDTFEGSKIRCHPDCPIIAVLSSKEVRVYDLRGTFLLVTQPKAFSDREISGKSLRRCVRRKLLFDEDCESEKKQD